jgi:hypothetical protein
MFGLFDGIKYRNEVTTQIHAILMLMPHLKSLTTPLKDAINAYGKEKTAEIEAAVWLSLAVIENLMVSIPPDTRLLTVQYLNEKKDGNFRWFANYAQAVTANQRPEHPEDVPPPLAAVIGFAGAPGFEPGNGGIKIRSSGRVQIFSAVRSIVNGPPRWADGGDVGLAT